MENLSLLANLAIASGIISLLCLLILHFTDPQFHPGWRMISEYALGKHKWLITSFFIFWGICSILTGVMLCYAVTSTWAIIGVVFLFINGIGALMGGLFDVKHNLHGLAFALGVPSLPIAALLITYQLINKPGWQIHSNTLLISAHSTWITVILMAISMMLLFSGFKKAGIKFGKDIEPPKSVPAGGIAVNGYANRLLVFCFVLWDILISYAYLNL